MMTRRWVWTVALCAFGASAAVGAELSINLNLAERAGVKRVNQPVAGGIPLPPGAVRNTNRLAVVDAAGRPVAAQFRVLSRHQGDNSVRWVLAAFSANVPANGKTTYRLVTGLRNPPPAPPVKVEPGPEEIVITTGPLKVVLSEKAFTLFRSVKLNGVELIKAGAEAGFVVEGMDAKRYVSGKDLIGPLKVKVLEAGPVRASILIEGVMKAGDNAAGYEVADGRGGTVKVPGRNGEKLGFSARYEFYAGQPFCRVFHTVRCFGTPYGQPGEDRRTQGWIYYVAQAAKQGNFFAKAAELVVNLKLDGGQEYALGGDSLHTGDLKPGDGAYLYQASSAGWTWQVAENKVYDPGLKSNIAFMKAQGKNKPYYEHERAFHETLTKREGCPFMGYKVYQGKRGAEAEKLSGNRAAGWAGLGGGKSGVMVAVRHFWQMYPKSLEVGSDGKLVVGLWPKRWTRGHLFEGRIHRTHEMLWSFLTGGKKAKDLVVRFKNPVYVLCDPEWYIHGCGFKPFGAAVTAKETGFGNYDGWALTAVHDNYSKGKINYSWDSSIAVEREKYDEFGWQHFVDGSKGGGMWYFGQFQEYDQTYTLMLHLARTGDPTFLATADETARFLMGIPAHDGGYGHQWAESSHAWSRGLGLYALLTGLYEAREAMDWMFDYHLQSGLREHHGKNNAWRFHGRNAAWATRGLHNAYLMTGEAKYLNELQRGRDIVKQRLIRTRGKYSAGGSSFQTGTIHAATGEYHYLTGDEVALDNLIAISEHFVATGSFSPEVIDGAAYAYLCTGYEKYKRLAEKGARHYLRKTFSGQPRYRTGTSCTKNWVGNLRYFQPYLYMKAHPRKNTAPPAAVKDLAAKALGGGKVELTWTAPGDNGPGGGKAATYYVKYSNAAIAEDSRSPDSFWAAKHATGEPAPGNPGTKETFRIADLKPGTYYFAVKTRDAARNLSTVSNVVQVRVE